MRTRRRATPVAVAAAIAAATAVAALVPTANAATLTVVESAPDIRVPSGLFTPTAAASAVYFGGMYSPARNPLGFAMGYVEFPKGGTTPISNNTLVLAFGSGPRIVAQAKGPTGPGAPSARPLLGGTGKYLGMRGVERSVKKGSTFTHTISYTLPTKGSARTKETYYVRYVPATSTPRGRADAVGDGRGVGGPITTSTGEEVGYYAVESVVTHSYSGGIYQWLVGDAVYRFNDGSMLRAIGPYQRATGSVAGPFAPSARVVTGGTGRYAGMRGQVVPVSIPGGNSSHAFTLVK
jgi:hypothetical protein